MKVHVLFLTWLFSIATYFCNGQNNTIDSSAAIIGFWEKGDVARYSIVVTKERYENDRLVSKDSSTRSVELLITKAAKRHYVINCRLTVIPAGYKVVEGTTGEDGLNPAQSINVQYKTSEYGEFQELLNWKQLRATIQAALEHSSSQYQDTGRSSISKEVKKIFSTRESMEEVVLKDIQLIHSLYGLEFILKKKITTESEIPNIFGGDPFPGQITIEMTSLDQVNNRCNIQMSQSFDRHKVTKEMNALMQKLAKSREINLPPVDWRDESNYEVDLENGWIVNSKHVRTVVADNIKAIEIREIKKWIR